MASHRAILTAIRSSLRSNLPLRALRASPQLSLLLPPPTATPTALRTTSRPLHITARPLTQLQRSNTNRTIRWSSSSTSSAEEGVTPYTFEQVKEMSERPSKQRMLIDVREPSELTQSGHIPTAVNLPLKTHSEALFLPADEFAERFGFAKPDAEKQEVVFYCRSGVRSRAAARLAREAGYTRVGDYGGSWLDWEGKGGGSENINEV